jgi:hypothetical protein
VAGHEAGVGDARQAAVAGVVQVAPGGGQRAAGALARGDLIRLAEIAQGEGAKVVGNLMLRPPSGLWSGKRFNPEIHFQLHDLPKYRKGNVVTKISISQEFNDYGRAPSI